jgi:predicted anti-sigma-YlaC factor YlaD
MTSGGRPMMCTRVAEELDDYLDGTLPRDEHHRLELHLAECADCREEEQTLRAILGQARALPAERAPSRDLWPGIRERLVAEAPSRGPLPFRAWGGGRAVLAAAAAVVIAMAGSWLLRHPRVPAEAPAVGTPVASSSQDPGLLDVERDYARATTELLAALHARREQLSPATVALVEENLRSIDTALAEIRVALERDPSNPGLTHMLASTHRRKVDVLQRVVRLSRS